MGLWEPLSEPAGYPPAGGAPVFTLYGTLAFMYPALLCGDMAMGIYIVGGGIIPAICGGYMCMLWGDMPIICGGGTICG